MEFQRNNFEKWASKQTCLVIHDELFSVHQLREFQASGAGTYRMALGVNGEETSNDPVGPFQKSQATNNMAVRSDENEEEEEEDDGEDDEPRLKYASLTKSQGPVYRNGDATSAFLVAGDKMVRF